MKITPLEIRQKTFEKAFRGLDKDEVQAFLVTLSQEWEKLVDENKEHKIKLEASQNEVAKLREVENSLFKTLKTAEDTGASMIDQATKTSELHLRETEMRAEAILNDAKNKAKDMIEEAEMKSRNTLDDMEDRIKALAHVYRTLDNTKSDLLTDIKSFANDAIERVDRVKAQLKTFDVEEELMRIKRESAEKKNSKPERESQIDFDNSIPKANTRREDVDNNVEEQSKSAKQEESKPKPQKQEQEQESTSFFDDIE